MKIFSKEQIINHLSDSDDLYKQVVKMLGKRLKKKHYLDYFIAEEEGLTCRIAEQMAYSEESYHVTIPWAEIDQWVEKNTRREYEIIEAFQKISEAYR